MLTEFILPTLTHIDHEKKMNDRKEKETVLRGINFKSRERAPCHAYAYVKRSRYTKTLCELQIASSSKLKYVRDHLL